MPNPLMDDVDDCLVGWLFVWLAGLLVIWLVGSCLFGLVWFDHMRANGIQLISVGQLASWLLFVCLVWFDHMRANGVQLISVGYLASWLLFVCLFGLV